jgi:hypothetical protein
MQFWLEKAEAEQSFGVFRPADATG